ncbi:purple acid phosphatase family protein [Actinomadura sp. HBU206391]|uniref:purple acid phosphatase family protein n=1 Tax=Actinomadura sp. HBU206391 TaxID=2731692 RepID=UPI001C9D5C95|nr:metallophosphoesterase family protein [Actinomadura sp. HBU206391]
MLRWSAVAAAAVPLAAVDPARGHAATGSGRPDAVLPVNLELVTLTEDRAIVTWYTGVPGTDDGLGRMVPAPADGEVRYGTHPTRLNRVAHGISSHTPYHHVELTDLEPGQTYYYQARSNGKPVSPMRFTLISGNAVGTSDHGLGTTGPFSFTTPQPPPGRFLFSVVLCNDLHMGETQAGLVGGQPQYIGISQVPGLPPYPEVMLESLVEDVERLKPTYLLAAGDISAEAVPADLSRSRRLLNRFGEYREDYFVTRGNHDRAHTGDPYAACRAGQWQGNDCFHDAYFAKDELTYFSSDLSGLRVIGLDTYDKPGGGGDAGGLSPEQLSWFRSTLAAHKDQPTLVFGHHPLVMADSAFPITAGNSLDAAQAASILDTYKRTPGVFLHHAGHTHRNHRTVSPAAPGVTLQEVAAVKEYPGGFSLLRLHTEGYALNFHKSRSELARAWSERSRQEIMGYWPQFALGNNVSDRNTVVRRDLSGLRRPHRHRGHGKGDHHPRGHAPLATD